jgi:hypothetical protein
MEETNHSLNEMSLSADERAQASSGKIALGVNKNVALFFFFIISYGIIFLLSLGRDAIGGAVAGIPVLNLLLPINTFDSPMYYLLPIVGFFFTYYIIDWANEYFETKFALSIWFPILTFVLSIFALYVSLFWLFSEVASFTGNPVVFDLWRELRHSAFYFFLLASLLAWGSRKLIEKL